MRSVEFLVDAYFFGVVFYVSYPVKFPGFSISELNVASHRSSYKFQLIFLCRKIE